MSKVNLSDLVNLENETTAVNTINSNSHVIELGFENTLSRDGTQPNSMGANFDMDSNRIFNLPAPGSATEPLRLQDLSDFIGGGTINTIPAGGTTGQVLGKLSSTDFDDGWISSRDPIDVRNFGVVGDGSADDTTAMQAALDSLGATLGGSLFIPAGLVVKCSGTLSIDTISNVSIVGETNFGHVVNYPSILRYTGTGSRFIDARNTSGFNLRNLSIDYTSSSFAGNLVDISSSNPGVTVSSAATVSNCHLGPNVSRLGTATLLNLNCHIGPYVTSTFFWRGAPAVVGAATSGQSVRVTLVNNWFSESDSCPIIEGGEGWVIQGNSFEPRTGGIGQAFANTNPCKGMIWSGNWFGDVATGAGTVWIDAHSVEGMAFIGNQIAGLGTIGGVGIKLTSCNGVQIDGNYFQLLDVGVNISTSSTGIKLGSNKFTNVTAPIQSPSNAITNDFTLGSDGSTSLTTVNSNVGTFGSATQVPIVTVNGKGLATAASNVTVTPAIGSVTGLATGVSTFLATPTSANLAIVLTDETGTGANVFANTPTLVTPILGAATATTINGAALDNLAWTTYTPTITSQSGTFTGATTTISGRYKQTGKTVIAQADVLLTALGSGSPVQGLRISLPFVAANFNYSGVSTEIVNTGTLGRAIVLAGSSNADTRKYDGSTWIVAGNQVIMTVIYETT